MSIISNSLPEMKFADLPFADKVVFGGRNLTFAIALYFFLDYILVCQVKTQEGIYSLFITLIMIIIFFIIVRYDKIKEILSRLQ